MCLDACTAETRTSIAASDGLALETIGREPAMGQYLPSSCCSCWRIAVRRRQPCSSSTCSWRRPSRTRPRRRRTSAASCPSREPPERFPVRFYLVAMIFIMFDIEIIFLYPYAVDLPRRSARSGSGRSSVFSVRVLPVVRVRGRQRRARLGSGASAAPALDAAGVAPSARPTTHHPPRRPRRPRSPSDGRGGRDGLVEDVRDEGLEGLDHNFLTGTLEDLVKWARRRSVVAGHVRPGVLRHRDDGAPAAPHYDLARFGMEVFRASPRQADLMIVAGRVSARRWPRCCARSTTR